MENPAFARADIFVLWNRLQQSIPGVINPSSRTTNLNPEYEKCVALRRYIVFVRLGVP